MSYTAFYRKFRPTVFEEVVGQEHIVRTLKNQIIKNRTGHAYLFCGTRGTGKTSVAKIFAKAVNCQAPVDGSPCGKCEMCREIAEGKSMNVIEIDAASNNSVDNVRQIREEVTYRPAQGRYKVYIIDEVHMLSSGAFNALLKTLEEPPEYVIFILATTEAARIPVTILSRCQRYDFRRMSTDSIVSHMNELLKSEGIKADEKGIRYLARIADGSMRDALSLLEQCTSCYMDEELTYDRILSALGAADDESFVEILEAVHARDVYRCMTALECISKEGKEMTQFVSDFTWYIRNLLLAGNSEKLEDVLDMTSENIERLKAESAVADEEELMRYIRILSELSGVLRTVSQKRIYVELALMKMCRPQTESNAQALLARISELEKKIETIEETGIMPAEKGYEERQKQPVQKKEPEKPKTAAPEDLLEICRNWQKITEKISMPFKGYLREAKLKYNHETKDGKLYITVEDDGIVLDDIKDKNRENELIKVIAEVMNRSVVPVFLGEGGEKNKELSLISVQEKIKKEINMPVRFE